MVKKSKFRELLRKSGYKATPSRLAILNVFQNAKSPLSAQRVIEALPRDTDQATVYRTLKSLKEKGIIKQIDLRHNHAHYELTDAGDHHHLVCVRCGRIEDVRDCGIDNAAILQHSRYFAEIRQHALEFYGICKSCLQSFGTADR